MAFPTWWDSPDKVLKGLKPPSETLKGLLTACTETTAVSAHAPTPCDKASFPQQLKELLCVFLLEDLFASQPHHTQLLIPLCAKTRSQSQNASAMVGTALCQAANQQEQMSNLHPPPFNVRIMLKILYIIFL